MVEHLLPKQRVDGSSPFSRSTDSDWVTNKPRPPETSGHAFGGVAQAGEFSFVLAQVDVEEGVNCRYRGGRSSPNR